MTERLVEEENVEGIAVIGMSGSYPGADDLDQFWRNLCDGVESITTFEERDHDRPPWADPDASYVPAKGVLPSAEWFDAGFFGYSPEEANSMDPQHRLFLERGWEALENSGYDTERYDGLVGVFAGVSANTYLLTNIFRRNRAARALMTDKDFVATRLAYKLNLRGPAIVVQSACSTSLVAVCLACQSLLNYQCDMAVAGGATVWAPTNSGYPYHPGGPLSPDGHCRAFDAAAQGFVPGSGAGAVVLKRLSDAVEDGDTIAAVIKGFAINNDGSGKVGYAAPSIDGQAEVIVAAHQLAEIDPATITYLEAHGTGTELGDPIEIAALTQAFREGTSEKGFCAVGSVKPNIGHLDAAAGIAGLTKAVLAVKERKLPPLVNFSAPNPAIDFENSPFFVNDQLREWQTGDQPRRAGVSAFGIGGTNAHVVLEESPAIDSDISESDEFRTLVVSAACENSLAEATTNLNAFLAKNPDTSLANLAYTLQVGRKRFPYRRTLVCRDRQSAIEGLQNATSACETRMDDTENRRVAFLFPGQAAQYPNMARGLYERFEVYREVVDQASSLLRADLGFDLRQLMFPSQDDDSVAERLTSTDIAQPAIFVTEYALAKLWMDLGVTPTACLGHSIGEYVAACLAGVFELKDALRIVAARGRLMNQMKPGAMLAVHLGEEEIRPHIGAGLSLAAVNGPSLCVLSGETDRIAQTEAELIAKSVTCIRLRTSHAFHSVMMEPMLDEFQAVVASAPRRQPDLPFISNLTGDWVDPNAAVDPGYWRNHVRSAVRFSSGLTTLCSNAELLLLEAGPGRTLTSLAQSNPDCPADQVVASTRHPRDTEDDVATFMRAVGKLWMNGVELDWDALYTPTERRRIPLPTYPFQRSRYWACDEYGDNADAFAETHATNDAASRFFTPTWKRSAGAGQSNGSTESGAAGVRLVFADSNGVAQRMVERLERQGATCITIEAGESFAKLGERSFRIQPTVASHYRLLVDDLNLSQATISGVVHCWGVGSADDSYDTKLRCAKAGFYSLIYLAQAIGAATLANDETPIHVLANGLFEVIGGERIVAENALLVGPTQVIPQEMPQLSVRLIDIQADELLGGGGADSCLEQIVTEICSADEASIVALRRGHRWVQDYEGRQLEEPSDGHTLPLANSGVYLITGGLGGMGLVLASWLARDYQAKLVLTARSALPARSEWDTYLDAHGPEDATSRRILGVRALEDAGAEVRVYAADATDSDQMRHVVEQTHSEWGPIQGVIHAAGVAGGGVVQLKTEEIAEQVFQPKVEGLRVLQQAIADQPIQFLVLCSSISAIAGGPGQVDYCAANAFLDAAAWEARANGGPRTIAINWNAWNEVGMAVETDLPAHLKALKAKVGLADSLSNAEGIDAIRRILADGRQQQIAVTLNNLPRFLAEQQKRRGQDLTNASTQTLQAKPEVASQYVEPQTETQRAVVQIWEELFGFEPIGIQDDYFELGGHSLMALQMIDRLRATLGADLVLGDLFEHKTIETLANRIDAAIWASNQTIDDGSDPDREITTL